MNAESAGAWTNFQTPELAGTAADAMGTNPGNSKREPAWASLHHKDHKHLTNLHQSFTIRT
jgi:hypothetical protein